MILIRNFAGEVPKVGSSLLGPSHAQAAKNVKLWSGILRSIRGPLAVDNPTKAGNIETIYRWGAASGQDAQGTITGATQANPVVITSATAHGLTTGDRVFITAVSGMTQINNRMFTITVVDSTRFSLNGENGTGHSGYSGGGAWTKQNGYWFHWTGDVDVDRGPVAGDTTERTYYTDGVQPKMTYSPIAVQSGTDYPVASYDLGIPAPASAPVAAKITNSGNITGATKANPVQITTSAAHNLQDADIVRITNVGGMTQINGRRFKITVVDATHFTLDDEDGTGHGTYTSGGTWEEKFDAADVRSRAYVMTYVSGIGEEGPPSGPSNIVSTGPGQQVDLSGLPTGPGGNYNITAKRLYRTVTGAGGTTYNFLVELALATTTYTDKKLDENLGELLPSEGWVAPPAAMKGIIAAANGIMAGFKGNELILSEPYQPHAYPVDYRKTTTHPIVAIAAFDTNIVAATEANPWVATGLHPASMAFRELAIGQGCASKRSMRSLGDFGVVYASPDGLVLISHGAAQIITEQLFSVDEWRQYNPSSMRGLVHDDRYYCFYTKKEGTQGGFYIDPKNIARGVVFLDFYTIGGFRDPLADALYLIQDNLIKQFEGDSSSKLTWTWRSRLYVQGIVEPYTAVRIVADSYSDLLFRLYAEPIEGGGMSLVFQAPVHSDRPFRAPGGYTSRKIEVELTGTDDVRSIAIAESVAELAQAA
jgi:hypothetical protein